MSQDLGGAVRRTSVFQQAIPGQCVTLPLALAESGSIDEYEFVVHSGVAGHGPTLFAGLSKHVGLKLVDWVEIDSGAMATTYETRP